MSSANNVKVPGCTDEYDAHLHYIIGITYKYDLVFNAEKGNLKAEYEVYAVKNPMTHVTEW